ncbi:MAG TPA: DUF1847 domain-containing protein [Methanocella sp.]|nr:DUF1847 domain-containing protein [Methanocella sp.]
MSEQSIETSKCAICTVKACCTDDTSKGPNFCATTKHKEQNDQALKLYIKDHEINKMIQASDRTQMRGDQKWTRIEDLIDFARQMGYKKIGLAFCGALSYEARILTGILENKGFTTVSVNCKSGAISKMDIGLPETEVAALQVKRDLGGLKIKLAKYEPSCNPIGQALVLNDEGTDFNVIVGLCLGHDTLFIKHSKAPVTVLIAQDRRLFHNPVAALHGTNSIYFAKLLSPGNP